MWMNGDQQSLWQQLNVFIFLTTQSNILPRRLVAVWFSRSNCSSCCWLSSDVCMSLLRSLNCSTSLFIAVMSTSQWTELNLSTSKLQLLNYYSRVLQCEHLTSDCEIFFKTQANIMSQWRRYEIYLIFTKM